MHDVKVSNTLLAGNANHPDVIVYPIENHPADSRTVLNKPTSPVQTLSSRMGTGGAMCR